MSGWEDSSSVLFATVDNCCKRFIELWIAWIMAWNRNLVFNESSSHCTESGNLLRVKSSPLTKQPNTSCSCDYKHETEMRVFVLPLIKNKHDSPSGPRTIFFPGFSQIWKKNNVFKEFVKKEGLRLHKIIVGHLQAMRLTFASSFKVAAAFDTAFNTAMTRKPSIEHRRVASAAGPS